MPGTVVQVVYCTKGKGEDEISLTQTNMLKRLMGSGGCGLATLTPCFA